MTEKGRESEPAPNANWEYICNAKFTKKNYFGIIIKLYQLKIYKYNFQSGITVYKNCMKILRNFMKLKLTFGSALYNEQSMKVYDK